MLGIRRIGAGRADYYLADLAAELPVAPGLRRADGSGPAAGDLGLDGSVPVEASQFRSLLAGRHPVTGRPLPLPTHGWRPAGGGLGPDLRRAQVGERRLRTGWRRSGSSGFGGARGGRGRARCGISSGTGWARPGGAVSPASVRSSAPRGSPARSFTHGVNRNLDPHLHSHVVVINAVHGEDGRWSACDGRGLDAHRVAAGSVYEAHLRYGLTSTLGVRWDPPTAPARTAEIAGVSPAVLGEFSSRGAEVRMHAFSVGARSARGRHVAWAVTRPPKTAGTPYDELAVEWRRRAGFAGPALELDLRVAPASPGKDLAPVEGSYDEHRFAGVIAVTPHGGAHRRDVVAAFAGSAAEGGAGGLARPCHRPVGARRRGLVWPRSS